MDNSVGQRERDGGVFIQSLIIFLSVRAVTLEAAAVRVNWEKKHTSYTHIQCSSPHITQ